LISKKLDINKLSKAPKFVIKINNSIELGEEQINHDIYYLNDFVGKIVKINNHFDLFVTHNDSTYYDFFDDYNECINFLYNL
jgi:hypothetical protein